MFTFESYHHCVKCWLLPLNKLEHNEFIPQEPQYSGDEQTAKDAVHWSVLGLIDAIHSGLKQKAYCPGNNAAKVMPLMLLALHDKFSQFTYTYTYSP